MSQSIFITGTHTAIGKTYSAISLAQHLMSQGKKVIYYKPIQTGNDNADYQLIKEFLPDIEIYYSYSLSLPATPLLAFQEENVIFSKEKIITDYQKLSQKADYIIVEGAGGVFVPIDHQYLLSDLIKDLNLKTLIISANYLGTINHTGMTIEHLQNKGIDIEGFAFAPCHIDSEYSPHNKVACTNAQIITQYTGLAYLGYFPLVNLHSKINLSDSLDLSFLK